MDFIHNCPPNKIISTKITKAYQLQRGSLNINVLDICWTNGLRLMGGIRQFFEEQRTETLFVDNDNTF